MKCRSRELCSRPALDGKVLCEEHFDIWRIRKFMEKYPWLEDYFGKEPRTKTRDTSIFFNRIRAVFTPPMMDLLFQLKDLWYGTGRLNPVPVEIEGIIYEPYVLKNIPTNEKSGDSSELPRELREGEPLRFASRFHVYKRKMGLFEMTSHILAKRGQSVLTHGVDLKELSHVLSENDYDIEDYTSYEFGNEHRVIYDEINLLQIGITIDAFRRGVQNPYKHREGYTFGRFANMKIHKCA